MSKEQVDEKMDLAYNLIEQGTPQTLSKAVEVLSQLKIKCPSELIDEVRAWEDKKDKAIGEAIDKIDSMPITGENDLFERENKKASKIKDYAYDYYMYYNKLRREYEIY